MAMGGAEPVNEADEVQQVHDTDPQLPDDEPKVCGPQPVDPVDLNDSQAITGGEAPADSEDLPGATADLPTSCAACGERGPHECAVAGPDPKEVGEELSQIRDDLVDKLRRVRWGATKKNHL